MIIKVEVPENWADGPGDTGESIRALVEILRPDIVPYDVTVERLYTGIQRVTIIDRSDGGGDIKIVNGEVEEYVG